MSKELEALNNIVYGYGYDDNVEIVSTALNRLEEYQKCIDLEHAKYISTHNMSVMDTETCDLLHERSKRLEELEKVLKIIKEKKVNTYYLMLFQSYIEYNDRFCKKQLTETEFDLLKDVLK